MKVLQVNNVYGVGSTGKLTQILHMAMLEDGMNSSVLYGRGPDAHEKGVIRICSNLYGKANSFISRFTGIPYGGCWSSTKKIIQMIQEEQPDDKTPPWKDAPETAAEQAEPKKQMTKQEFLYTIQSKVTDLTARIPADKVKALLNKHGASSLSALPPEKYEAFLYDFNRL